MGHKALSLKYHLTGEVEEFLDFEKITCPHIRAGLVELINQISSYKEEGKMLFPEVYITDDINSIRNSLVSSEFHLIGSAVRSRQIIMTALKKCAPLAIGGWSIYVLGVGENFEYGLFRSGSSIISIPIAESLMAGGNAETNLILIRQVADKIVEVRGVKDTSLTINFGIKSTASLSPLAIQQSFIEKIVEKVDETIKDQCKIFLNRLFQYVTQNGHGNLSLVISAGGACPDFLTDGILLGENISFAERIRDVTKALTGDSKGHQILEANAKLNGVFNMICGMMMSDGITLFSNDGAVCGYNIFLKHPENDEALKKVEGGARSRTYYVMTQKLSDQLIAVYMQSQDGETKTKANE